MPRKESMGEILMAEQLRHARIAFGREYEFYPGRKWRADFLIRHNRSPILLEVEGGHWLRGAGGHSGGRGFEQDCEKYAHAAIMGYRVIRATTDQVEDGTALHWVRLALGLSVHARAETGGRSRSEGLE